MTRFIVIFDSCILYSAPLRDLLIRLAMADLYHAKWTEHIHQEWMENLLKNRPDLTINQLQKTRQLMDLHARDCLVQGYEDLLDSLILPDQNDRHVLAAAIRVNAQVIVTYNLSDFPNDILAKYEVSAQHPDQFMRHLIDLAPTRFLRAVHATRANLKQPPKNPTEYLDILEQQSLPQTTAFLRSYQEFI